MRAEKLIPVRASRRLVGKDGLVDELTRNCLMHLTRLVHVLADEASTTHKAEILRQVSEIEYVLEGHSADKHQRLISGRTELGRSPVLSAYKGFGWVKDGKDGGGQHDPRAHLRERCGRAGAGPVARRALAMRLLVPWGTRLGSGTTGKAALVASYGHLMMDADIARLVQYSVKWAAMFDTLGRQVVDSMKFVGKLVEGATKDERKRTKWRRMALKVGVKLLATAVSAFGMAPLVEMLGSYVEETLQTAGPMSTEHQVLLKDGEVSWAGASYDPKFGSGTWAREGGTRALSSLVDEVTGTVKDKIEGLGSVDPGKAEDIIQVIVQVVGGMFESFTHNLSEQFGQRTETTTGAGDRADKLSDTSSREKRRTIVLADVVYYAYGAGKTSDALRWSYGSDLFGRHREHISFVARRQVRGMLDALKPRDLNANGGLAALDRVLRSVLLAQFLADNEALYKSHKLRSIAAPLIALGWLEKGTYSPGESERQDSRFRERAGTAVFFDEYGAISAKPESSQKIARWAADIFTPAVNGHANVWLRNWTCKYLHEAPKKCRGPNGSYATDVHERAQKYVLAAPSERRTTLREFAGTRVEKSVPMREYGTRHWFSY